MSNALKLALLMVLGGLGYAGFEYYEFHGEKMAQMKTEIQMQEQTLATKQGELVRLKEFAQNIERIKQELRELNFQLESALEYMPRAYNMSTVLRKLTLLAQNSGLDLSVFKPSGPENRTEGAFYSTVPISVTTRGTFAQTLVFFDQISRLKRIINADDIAMSIEDGAAQRSNAVLITHAKLRTYRFSE